MATKPNKGRSWITLLLGIAAVAVWLYGQREPLDSPATPVPSRSEKTALPPVPVGPEKNEKIGGYEIYRNCKLVETRNNDGDSFKVKLPNGRESELRLYFVDTPESAFKSYRGGDTNHQRIAEQAAEMGGITPQQAVQIGQDAKYFTLSLLESRPFTIYTRWDSPFRDERYHAFIEVQEGGKNRWLHEVLTEKGFVRIHTKGADLPDGTPYASQKSHLKALESAAKRAGAGVWGID